LYGYKPQFPFNLNRTLVS